MTAVDTVPPDTSTIQHSFDTPRRPTMFTTDDLARAHQRDLREDAQASARARRVLAARRWQRRSERAQLRARLAQSAIR